MTPNPLARHRRLGQALAQLRTDQGLRHNRLAQQSGVPASAISRLENPIGEPRRRPSIDDVTKLLDALEAPAGLRETLIGWARTAAEPRWWDYYQGMGEGQRTHARVELAAAEILEYGALLIPGLVQTEEYARHRVMAANGTPVADPDAVVAGRMARQQVLDAAEYRLVVEEQAVRRMPVPPGVMVGQLEHLLEVSSRPNMAVRVLPVDADLGCGFAPRAPFAHVCYHDPEDPRIVAVDNDASQPRLVTVEAEVDGYERLHSRLWGAALSEGESVELIDGVAGKLRAAG